MTILGNARPSTAQAIARDPAPYALIVEDEPLVSNVLALSLRESGFVTRELEGAVGIVDALAPMPSLIVLDVSLRGSDAVEILSMLAAAGYRGGVLLVSAASPRLLDEIRRVGQWRGIRMLSPLRKPFRMADIRAIADRESEAVHCLPAVPAAAAPMSRVVMDCADALGRGWIESWYQPKCDIATGRVVGAEALARLRHPEAGILLPASFLPGDADAAMEDLTALMLRRACEDWTMFSSVDPRLRLAVNIPSGALVSLPVAAIVRAVLPADLGEWPGLVLEITEEEACKDIDKIHEIGTQLSIYKVDLSIDDFGLGYSNLSRLKDLPFREIKIDRSLVQHCYRDETRAALCRAVVDLAHAYDAKVVAEGVERGQELDYLAGMGCDVAQGYFLGHPMPRDVFQAWLRARTAA